MRIIYTLLVLLFLSVPEVFATDVVYSRDGSVQGRIKSYVDGLMIIKSGGIEHLYTRAMAADYYGDYIKYRPSAFSFNTKEVNCRIVFIDRYNVHYMKSPNSKVEIPRYRIKTMIFNTK